MDPPTFQSNTTASSSTTAEDSDNDEIVDFLNPTTTTIHVNTPTNPTTIIKLNKSNMIPTINVTPHSPAAASKYNNLFEDTLSQLQNIRETVVQMKNSGLHMQDGLINAAILSSSLPDLSANNKNAPTTISAATAAASGAAVTAAYLMWSPHQQQYLLNTDRRKSWTAADDLNTTGDGTNKSVSLSSLDSEEQETIRVTEQRRRSARNSTGGISTHSLNEAELARDFERMTTKRTLNTEINSRIPLQKSISTSSIVAKEELNKAITRHLTDSEDENQSLLRAHAKIEVYDNVEKRRKRGSLFFRKKKDKIKLKALQNATSSGNNVTCEICGANTNNLKEHHIECMKVKKFILSKHKNGNNSGNELSQDCYDGNADNNATSYQINYNEEAPLIRAEFLNEPAIVASDLAADTILGIDLDEHDSWSPSVPKELLKTLKEKQIKRQEHIYEFIMTEKHHCQTLLVMQKVFIESLEKHFNNLNVQAMFPRLNELTTLHTSFLSELRLKQRENYIVDSIADILLKFFSDEQAQQLRLVYGEFCANHRAALEEFKTYIRDQRFAQWYKHCLTNPLLKKKGIPECILFVTQRLTKYPLLIEPLLKNAKDLPNEAQKLQEALNLVKALLVDVDACVAEQELRVRQIELYKRIDAKSFAIYQNKPFRKSELSLESQRRLKFEGLATLMQGRAKMQLVLLVVLTDCLCFFVENSAHNKYTFFTPEHKAGVVPLQKLLIREKAGTESRGIYIISSNPDFPEMYELKVQQPKDKQTWIQAIRQAVLEAPSAHILTVNDIQLPLIKRKELVEQLQQKDIEQALVLAEKMQLQVELYKEQNTSVHFKQFLDALNNVCYKNLVDTNTDMNELWQRVQYMVQEITQLANNIYTAAAGSGGVSGTGGNSMIRHASPTLPKRAETFAGFDEKRGKHIFPLTPRLRELEETAKIVSSGSVVGATGGVSLENEHNLATIQISHQLNTLLCIISQQITCLQQLQLQLSAYKDSPRVAYTHNDQLEELRNLQDKLQEEKQTWLRQRELQELDLEEQRAAQLKLQQDIKREQEDIKQQREQLYRKMELLSNQGLLISPNTIIGNTIIHDDNLDITDNTNNTNNTTISNINNNHNNTINSSSSSLSNTIERRKDKWRTASSIINNIKTPPVNLLSATNAPKIINNQQIIKQKIPIKLSSLSSGSSTISSLSGSSTSSANTHYNSNNKIDKSASFNTSGGITQLFPLKLSTTTTTTSTNINNDKQQRSNNNTTNISHGINFPQHSRTGSSPAVIQHNLHKTNSPTLTNSNKTTITITTNNTNTTTNNKNTTPTSNKPIITAAEEEEIYF